MDFAIESSKRHKGIMVIYDGKVRKYKTFQYNPETVSVNNAAEIPEYSAMDYDFFEAEAAIGAINQEVSFSIIFENILSKIDIEKEIGWFEYWQRKRFWLFLGSQKFAGNLSAFSWDYKSFWPNLDPQYVEIQIRIIGKLTFNDAATTSEVATKQAKARLDTSQKILNSVNKNLTTLDQGETIGR